MQEEFFDVVNEDDMVIGDASRAECHEQGLIHRSVMFFVFDSERKVLVTKRTQNKDFFPGYFSIVLGGHVHSGESYKEAAVREIKEEIEVDAQPYYMESFEKRIPEEKENVKVFGVNVDGEIILNKEELESGEFIEVSELKERIKDHDFLPETEKLLQILKRHLSSR